MFKVSYKDTRTTPKYPSNCCFQDQPTEVFCKKVVLRNFVKFTEKHMCQEACNLIKKETLAQIFSCEFCKISKKTFFTEHLPTRNIILSVPGKDSQIV